MTRLYRERRVDTRDGDIIVSDCQYASGLREISFSVPEYLSGAGKVCIAVASRQDPGGKWRVTASHWPVGVFPSRKRAYRAAMVEAQAYYNRRAHFCGVVYTPPKGAQFVNIEIQVAGARRPDGGE